MKTNFNLPGKSLACVAMMTLWDAATAQAQYRPPQSYKDYYHEQITEVHAPPRSTVNYTIDKYYYHNPAVSPYLNLVRPTSGNVPRYQTYVQPELERRNAAKAAQAVRPLPAYQSIPNFGGPAPKKAAPYHDHWYGGLLTGP